jgi:hypothetical protein
VPSLSRAAVRPAVQRNFFAPAHTFPYEYYIASTGFPFWSCAWTLCCGERSPIKGGQPAVASGDCTLDRVRVTPRWAIHANDARLYDPINQNICGGSATFAPRSGDACAAESGDAFLRQSSVLLTGTLLGCRSCKTE